MNNQPEKANWETQLLRLSLFLIKPLEGEVAFWRAISGKDPERLEKQPREASTTESGEFRNGLLRVTTTPFRIDVLYSSLPSVQLVGHPPSVGPFPMSFELFARAVGPWLLGLNVSAHRIAVGGILVRGAKDQESAYKALMPYVSSLKIDPINMRDLIYRVNWREAAPSTGKVEYLNRITTWSVQRIVVSQIGPAAHPAETISDFAQLEFDHNSPVESRDPLSGSELAAIFELLAGLALENAERGERP